MPWLSSHSLTLTHSLTHSPLSLTLSLPVSLDSSAALSSAALSPSIFRYFSSWPSDECRRRKSRQFYLDECRPRVRTPCIEHFFVICINNNVNNLIQKRPAGTMPVLAKPTTTAKLTSRCWAHHVNLTSEYRATTRGPYAIKPPNPRNKTPTMDEAVLPCCRSWLVDSAHIKPQSRGCLSSLSFGQYTSPKNVKKM